MTGPSSPNVSFHRKKISPDITSERDVLIHKLRLLQQKLDRTVKGNEQLEETNSQLKTLLLLFTKELQTHDVTEENFIQDSKQHVLYSPDSLEGHYQQLKSIHSALSKFPISPSQGLTHDYVTTEFPSATAREATASPYESQPSLLMEDPQLYLPEVPVLSSNSHPLHSYLLDNALIPKTQQQTVLNAEHMLYSPQSPHTKKVSIQSPSTGYRVPISPALNSEYPSPPSYPIMGLNELREKEKKKDRQKLEQSLRGIDMENHLRMNSDVLSNITSNINSTLRGLQKSTHGDTKQGIEDLLQQFSPHIHMTSESHSHLTEALAQLEKSRVEVGLDSPPLHPGHYDHTGTVVIHHSLHETQNSVGNPPSISERNGNTPYASSAALPLGIQKVTIAPTASPSGKERISYLNHKRYVPSPTNSNSLNNQSEYGGLTSLGTTALIMGSYNENPDPPTSALGESQITPLGQPKKTSSLSYLLEPVSAGATNIVPSLKNSEYKLYPSEYQSNNLNSLYTGQIGALGISKASSMLRTDKSIALSKTVEDYSAEIQKIIDDATKRVSSPLKDVLRESSRRREVANSSSLSKDLLSSALGREHKEEQHMKESKRKESMGRSSADYVISSALKDSSQSKISSPSRLFTETNGSRLLSSQLQNDRRMSTTSSKVAEQQRKDTNSTRGVLQESAVDKKKVKSKRKERIKKLLNSLMESFSDSSGKELSSDELSSSVDTQLLEKNSSPRSIVNVFDSNPHVKTIRGSQQGLSPHHSLGFSSPEPPFTRSSQERSGLALSKGTDGKQIYSHATNAIMERPGSSRRQSRVEIEGAKGGMEDATIDTELLLEATIRSVPQLNSSLSKRKSSPTGPNSFRNRINSRVSFENSARNQDLESSSSSRAESARGSIRSIQASPQHMPVPIQERSEVDTVREQRQKNEKAEDRRLSVGQGRSEEPFSSQSITTREKDAMIESYERQRKGSNSIRAQLPSPIRLDNVNNSTDTSRLFEGEKVSPVGPAKGDMATSPLKLSTRIARLVQEMGTSPLRQSARTKSIAESKKYNDIATSPLRFATPYRSRAPSLVESASPPPVMGPQGSLSLLSSRESVSPMLPSSSISLEAPMLGTPSKSAQRKKGPLNVTQLSHLSINYPTFTPPQGIDQGNSPYHSSPSSRRQIKFHDESNSASRFELNTEVEPALVPKTTLPNIQREVIPMGSLSLKRPSLHDEGCQYSEKAESVARRSTGEVLGSRSNTPPHRRAVSPPALSLNNTSPSVFSPARNYSPEKSMTNQTFGTNSALPQDRLGRSLEKNQNMKSAVQRQGSPTEYYSPIVTESLYSLSPLTPLYGELAMKSKGEEASNTIRLDESSLKKGTPTFQDWERSVRSVEESSPTRRAENEKVQGRRKKLPRDGNGGYLNPNESQEQKYDKGLLIHSNYKGKSLSEEGDDITWRQIANQERDLFQMNEELYESIMSQLKQYEGNYSTSPRRNRNMPGNDHFSRVDYPPRRSDEKSEKEMEERSPRMRKQEPKREVIIDSRSTKTGLHCPVIPDKRVKNDSSPVIFKEHSVEEISVSSPCYSVKSGKKREKSVTRSESRSASRSNSVTKGIGKAYSRSSVSPRGFPTYLS